MSGRPTHQLAQAPRPPSSIVFSAARIATRRAPCTDPCIDFGVVWMSKSIGFCQLLLAYHTGCPGTASGRGGTTASESNRHTDPEVQAHKTGHALRPEVTVLLAAVWLLLDYPWGLLAIVAIAALYGLR
jgi:hypothetical protein